MLATPNCYMRKCIYYVGVKNDSEPFDESKERNVCKAFPDRIPEEIAYGSNKHLKPYPGDHGIQLEKSNRIKDGNIMEQAAYQSALVKLREINSSLEKDQEIHNIVKSKSEVLVRFQPIFSPDNLPILSEQDFKDFLLFKNNKHWNLLFFFGAKICSDMESLRNALMLLVDESKSIEER